MSFEAIYGLALSVFPEKSKYKEVYLFRDTSYQWLVCKYTIAIIVSVAPHLQQVIFKTGAWQEADIKINDMNSVEMPSEGKDHHKIRAK